MKLREIILQNFRGYYNETRIPIDDLTALIGQNDVGKSTILEALDIFFNQAKIETGDRNVLHIDEETTIGCVFDDLPETITLEDVFTSFSGEFLLNGNGEFEVHKKYPMNGKQTIWIYARHPSNEGYDDLLLKKNNELKAKIRAAGLASTLTPKFKKDPMWEKAFSFSLTGENAIPLNKRGSGIRRLVLFSFFRATTESALFEGKNIIYAVEEPETSQHPDAQRMIVNTFREMTEKNGCQVIITTHVPGLAGMLPLKSLRYITNGEGYPEVASGEDNEELLKRIADTLGVYPDIAPALAPHHGVKLIVCVEGPNDVAFLTAISKIAHQSDGSIIDLAMSQNVVILPLGGSVLKDWVNLNYLQKLNTREYHIYDSDNRDAHATECARVNQRGDGSSARMTRKREMENYIHGDVVQEIFGIQININDTMDVSTEISNIIRATNPEGYKAETVKKKLNKLCAPQMTMELLHSRDPEGEVLGWLREISHIVQE